jgi:uroporphyrinogen III methyltransferase/synthase
MSSNPPLTGRTVLIAPPVPLELTRELERHGARVICWPKLDIRATGNYAALDEAIENLFGYDWLIFRNVHAVLFFLGRFQTLGHEISELDSLRVCALGQDTIHQLEESHVHIDVIPDRLSTEAICEAIETCVSGREALHGLNFLVPSAGSSRTRLQDALEDAGARADLVATYRTSAPNDPNRINALLTGGGIDCVAFMNASDANDLAQLFDTSHLGGLLAGVAVACIDQETAQSAAALGLAANIIPEHEAPDLARAIASYFRG